MDYDPSLQLMNELRHAVGGPMSSQRESSPAESDVFHDASEISSRKVDAGDHGMMDQGNDGETIPDSESERDDVEHTPPDQHHGVYGTSNNDRDNAVFGESHDEEMEDAINPRLANSRQNTPSVLDGNANDQTQRHASHEMDMPDHPGWDHQPDCSGSPGASTPARSVSPEESSEDSAVEGSNEDNDSASSNDEDADDTESGQGDKEAVDSSGDEDDISVVEVDASNWIQEADPVQTGKEMDKELRRHHILHAKARDLMPHSLPRHRYWVAILTHLVQPKDARKEKDFLWIKANRINTVETIWHTYQNATTESDFRLWCHGESPEFEDMVEELNFYNDNFVVFRAELGRAHQDHGGVDKPILIDD